jgi:hypothetical protein
VSKQDIWYIAMRLKLGDYQLVNFKIVDENNEVIADLTTATAIKFSIKQNKTDLDVNAILLKTLDSGITINTPSMGWIQVEILSTDITSSLFSGDKYMALQIEYSETKKIEVIIVDQHREIETIEIDQDIIR